MLKFDKVDYRSKKISKDKGIQGHYIKNRELNPWVRKIPCRRAWQPTLTFFPGDSPGQRSLADYIVHGVTKSWT